MGNLLTNSSVGLQLFLLLIQTNSAARGEGRWPWFPIAAIPFHIACLAYTIYIARKVQAKESDL